MLTCTGFAADSADAKLAPMTFSRRDLGTQDVQIEILFCGVCHSDLHYARNEWRFTVYPAIPGHEIIGRVTAIGNEVKNFKIGEHVGVGCIVDSCRTCASCREGLEQYCETGMIGTYGATEPVIGGPTHGGYSNGIVVDKNYVLRIPDALDLAAAAPLLCAGITLYSPLRHWQAGPGKKIGIIGLGGLGHMGVKLSHAMGATTVLFTTSASKVADGKRLGASQVVISNDEDAMAAQARSFDLILDTVSAAHSIAPFLNLLKRDATIVQVGAPEQLLAIPVMPLLMKRNALAGTMIGGIAQTQEMLDFCAEKNIAAEVEIIPIQYINEAYERMLKSDVKYRFSIDMASLGKAA